MINIYLKTPYKVLTIDEIKTKEKQDKEREFLDASSPNRLFIAENNLKIHTMYREKNKYASTSKGRKFQKTLNYFSGDEECNLQNYNTKTRMIKDSSISQMSESKSTKNQYVHD